MVARKTDQWFSNPVFESFIDFDKHISDKYSAFIVAHPLLFLLLERELRKHEAGRERLSAVSALSEKGRFIKNLADFVYFSFARNLLHLFYRGSKFDFFVLNLNRFPDVEKKIKCALTDFSERRYQELPWLLRKTIHLEVNRGQVLSKCFERVQSVGWKAFLDDEIFCSRMERNLEKNILSLGKSLRHYNLKFILSQEEFPPSSRILAEACRRANIDYFVLAHGYIQDPLLVSIAPILAKKLFVWTSQQKELLIKLDVPADRVDYLGNPSIFEDLGKPQSMNTAVICWHPLGAVNSVEEEIGDILTVSRQLSKNFKVIIRLHPKDKGKYFEKIRESLVTLENVILSSDPFKVDLARAGLFFGTNSSTLFQAACNGRKSFQFDEYAIYFFEDVGKVSMEDLVDFGAFHLDVPGIAETDESFADEFCKLLH